jgi:ATP synthase protein I
MFRVVAAQFAVSLLVSIVAWVVGGLHAGVSSMLGALACAVPNALFALNLSLLGNVPGPRNSSAGGEADRGANSEGARATAVALLLLAGEFFKVALTIGLLVLVAWVYKDVVWLALIVAVIAVLMMQVAALAWH